MYALLFQVEPFKKSSFNNKYIRQVDGLVRTIPGWLQTPTIDTRCSTCHFLKSIINHKTISKNETVH